MTRFELSLALVLSLGLLVFLSLGMAKLLSSPKIRSVSKPPQRAHGSKFFPMGQSAPNCYS